LRLPQDVPVVLETLLGGVRAALADNLVAVYPRGSLATGDLLPTSDIDILTVTQRPLDSAEFAALAALHDRVAALPSPYSARLEQAYIDRAALRRFTPGQRHPTLYWNEPFAWSEHGPNWVLERWTVREHATPLRGPDPKALIDAIAPDEVRAAVRARLCDWADWADGAANLAGWPILYTLETMCRALCTLAGGGVASKARAVAWAIVALPEPWRSLAERSQAWRAGAPLHREVVGPEVVGFVRWAASQGLHESSGRNI
jgi:predicted nucleotidyltransferase